MVAAGRRSRSNMKTDRSIKTSSQPARLATSLAVALLVLSGVAQAEQGGDRARDLFMEGIEAFQDEDYESALQAFRLSYQINPVASVLYNIAMCHRALIQYVDSIDAFERYLADGGERISGGRRQEVEGLMRDMLQLIGRLRFNITPAEASVEVDDVPVELSQGRTLRVGGGTHTVRVGFAGHEEEIRQIEAPLGVVTEVNIDLEPATERVVTPAGRPWYRTWWFWTIVGVAAATGVGVGLGVGLNQDEGIGSGDWDVRLP